jgi:4,5-DOPA dioxygenase extradiol
MKPAPPNRRRTLQVGLAGAGAMLLGCQRPQPPARAEPKKPNASTKGSAMTTASQRMPVLFVGHGSPMNAIDENQWTRGFRALAALLPRPRAVLSVSAHWFVRGTMASDNVRPPTIHDFGGFPQALFDMEYPAPGDPALARQVVGLLGAQRASLSAQWGLDHGTWTVLHHLLPKADVPVVQLSIDAFLPPAEHVALGRALAGLRDEGVLVMGSGNVTHNLRHAMRAIMNGDNTTPDWASRFDKEAATAIEQHDGAFLARLVATDAGRMSHPTIDHYLPLLYAVGAAGGQDPVRFPIAGFDGGSLSMRSVLFG